MKKLITSLRDHGVRGTIDKCVRFPGNRLRHWVREYWRWRLQRSSDRRAVFTAIHALNTWGSDESVSGPGSTVNYTTNLRTQLPILFREFSIKSVFDAPCGDFNWMRLIVAENQIEYLGGDIVPTLVSSHRRAFGSSKIRFTAFDITRDKFPPADLWICRDCLFHLPYRDILAALRNYSASSIPFVLLTNHRNLTGFSNHDIRIGDFRRLDLFAPPFGFPRTIKFRIQEGNVPDSEHEMCLWERGQIAAALPRFESALESVAAKPPVRN